VPSLPPPFTSACWKMMGISSGLLMTDKVTPAMKYQDWGGNEGWPRRNLSSAGDRIRGGDGGAIATNVQRKQALEESIRINRVYHLPRL